MMNNMRHNQANYLHHHQQQQQQQQLHHHQHQLQHQQQQHHQMQRQTAGLNHMQHNQRAANNVAVNQQHHPHGAVNRPSRSSQPQQHAMSHQQQQQQQHHHQPVRSASSSHNGQPMAPPRQPQQQQQQPIPRSQSQSQAQQPPAQAQPQQPAPPPLPNPLPKGWKREEVVRTRGICAGLTDVVYTPSEKAEPTLAGRRFRSKLELQRHFGDRYDMSLLDYRTGKLAQVVYKKQRRLKSIAAGNAANYTLAAKYDMYLNMPNRQTVSIFKQPVHYVTNNQKYNEPTPAYVKDYQPNSAQSMAAVMAAAANNSLTQNQLNVLARKIDKPRPVQIFWEMRFNNLQHVDAMCRELNYKYDFDLVNLSKFKNLNISNESALRSVAVSWYLNPNKLLIGQDREFIKNPRVYLDRDQPLIPNLVVKEDDIKQQESKVKELREKIKQALSELASMESESSHPIDDDDDHVDAGDDQNDQEAVPEKNSSSTEVDCKPEIKEEVKIDDEPVQVEVKSTENDTNNNYKNDDAQTEKPNHQNDEDVQMNEEPVKNESANAEMEVVVESATTTTTTTAAETETETETKPKSPAQEEESVNTKPTNTDEINTTEKTSNDETKEQEDEKKETTSTEPENEKKNDEKPENASTETDNPPPSEAKND